ncbi:MAG: helix-turn-helix transcriptional regulator, partial [Clostridia bacterium]|nr:helix-turn-helix transcriptional regulator [Clostridia bacterium]
MRYTEYLEKKRHGSPKFPLQYYYVDESHPQYIMQAHWHKEFEIVRIIKGELSLYLNNTKNDLRKGDILFTSCRTLHRAEPKECVYECIVFDLNMLLRQNGDLVEKYILPIISSSVDLNCHLHKSSKALYQTTSSLFEIANQKKKGKELEILGLLFQIFSLLYQEEYVTPKMEISSSPTEKSVIRAIRYIQENFQTQISLKKLSEVAGVNEKYLCRIFKEYTS